MGICTYVHYMAIVLEKMLLWSLHHDGVDWIAAEIQIAVQIENAYVKISGKSSHIYGNSKCIQSARVWKNISFMHLKSLSLITALGNM